MSWIDPLTGKIVMPDLITTLAGAALLGLVSFVAAKIFGRVRVRRLRASLDADFDAFYTLCKINIPADELEPKAEMARYLDEGEEDRRRSPSTARFEDYFAVAKVHGVVAGFINASIYPKARLGFVNYLGTATDGVGSARTDSTPLLRALARRMRRLSCNAVIYEIDPIGPHLPRGENGARHARGQRFIQIARQAGYATFQMPIEYVQPALSLLAGQHYSAVPMVLMYVSLQKLRGRPPAVQEMTKSRIIEILDVVLLQWYLDIYDREGTLRDQFREELTTLRNRLTASLSETVLLAPLGHDWSPPVRAGASTPREPIGLSRARRRKHMQSTAGAKG